MAGVTLGESESGTWGQPTSGSASRQKKSHSDLIRKYRDRLTATKRWREDEKYDRTWKRLRDVYRLRPFQNWSSDDRIAVSIAFSTINVIGPSVAVNYPKISVNSKAEDPDQVNKALMVEAIINYWWRTHDFRDEVRKVVQDYLIYGHGWGKVGWHYSEEARELSEEEQAENIAQQNDLLDQFADDNPHMVADLPTHSDVVMASDTMTVEATEDSPFFERVSPFDVFVDPEATSMKDAQWIAQRVVMPLDMAKEDERFAKSARRKLRADGSYKWFNEDDKNAIPDDHGRITIWEFYDLIDGTLSIFADKQTDVGFLVKPMAFPYPYGHPFVMLRNYEVPDQFYTIGEIEAIEPLQNELNHTRSAMVLARKLDIPKYLVRKDALDADAIDALTSNDTNALIPIRDDTPFPEVVAPVPRNDANAQFYMHHSEVIESDIDRVTGVNEYMRGALPEVRRTATEASIIQDAANARAADKLARIETYIAEVASRLVMLAQTFLTTEQVARITTEQGAQVWVPYSREDIEGEYDFDVEAGSTQPQNETFKRQQAIQLMNTMGPLIGQVIDPAALAMHVLREGFGVKQPERFLIAGQPPMPPGGDGTMPPGAVAPDAGAQAVPPSPEESGEMTPDQEMGEMDPYMMAGNMSALQATGMPPEMMQ